MPTPYKLTYGDCLSVLREMEPNSVDAIVTDPPYGLRFMAKHWDYDVPTVELWREVLRVLKPGGHALIACGTRTQHRMAVNIEDAGFEIRDVITWLYGSGFPKSLDVSKAIDKAAGASREVVGPNPNGRPNMVRVSASVLQPRVDAPITAPSTEAAKQWAGWGTALKPACEFWTLARKPLIGTVAQNVLKHGVGGINVDGCRVEVADDEPNKRRDTGGYASGDSKATVPNAPYNSTRAATLTQGRFPANLILDEEAAALLDEQVGFLHGAGNKKLRQPGEGEKSNSIFGIEAGAPTCLYDRGGSASRFFYVAKASKSERNAGLDGVEQIAFNESECSEENTVAVQLLQKATSDAMVSWSIAECGKRIMARFPRGTMSTIETKTKLITASKTLSYLASLLTSGSTQDVSCAAMSGGNHAENAVLLNLWLESFTEGKTALALGAARVASQTLQKINESAEPDAFKNGHATVKPVKLMRYLCRLITPPGGLVLDPFAGSGSTGVAALKEGFRFQGIEREAEYIAIASARLASHVD